MNTKITVLLWFLLQGVSIALLCVGGQVVFGVSNAWTDYFCSQLNFEPDAVSLSILGLFLVGTVVNFLNTLFLLRNLSHTRLGVKLMHRGRNERLEAEGLLGAHIESLYRSNADGLASVPSQEASLRVIQNRLHRREWMTRSASNLLLTLGLVGTVLGLSASLGGLSQTITAVSQATDLNASQTGAEANVDVNQGLQQALGGMATAFSTTLFGAVLGGILLKLLYQCTLTLTEELTDRIELIAEEEVIPFLRSSTEDVLKHQERKLKQWSMTINEATKRELARFAAVSKRVDQLTSRFEHLSRSIETADSNFLNCEQQLQTLERCDRRFRQFQEWLTTPVLKIATVGIGIVAAIGIVRLISDIVY